MKPKIHVFRGLYIQYYSNDILYVCCRPDWSNAKVAKAIKNNFPINKWEKRLIASRMRSYMSMEEIHNHIAIIRNAKEVISCNGNEFYFKFQ